MISHKTDIIHLGEYSVENIAYKLISSSQSNIINNRNIPKRGQILSSYLLFYLLPPARDVPRQFRLGGASRKKVTNYTKLYA